MHDDWFDFLIALHEHGVRHLVVGAHALAVHGVPRATQDLDVWIELTDENVDRVWAALAEFGAPLESLGVSRADLADVNSVLQIGTPPARIDVLSALTGLHAFADAWRDRYEQTVRGLTVPFLGRAALLQNKRATGRLKDLADVEALGESVSIAGIRPFPATGRTVTDADIDRLREEEGI
jgi:hypothetical protein